MNKLGSSTESNKHSKQDKSSAIVGAMSLTAPSEESSLHMESDGLIQNLPVRKTNRFWYAVHLLSAVAFGFGWLFNNMMAFNHFVAAISGASVIRVFFESNNGSYTRTILKILQTDTISFGDFIQTWQGLVVNAGAAVAFDDKIRFYSNFVTQGCFFVYRAMLCAFYFCACMRCLSVDPKLSYDKTLKRFVLAYILFVAIPFLPSCFKFYNVLEFAAVSLSLGLYFFFAFSAMKDLKSANARRLLPVFAKDSSKSA